MNETENSKNNLSNKPKLLILTFSIFFIALVALYFLYFDSFQSKKITKKIESSNLSEILANPEKDKVEKVISEIPKILEKKEVECVDLSFYKQFLRISIKAYKGEDYSQDSISIENTDSYGLYKVELLELLSLAKENLPDHYFISEFNDLTNKFYQESGDSLLYNEFSKDFFRYRKIGNRALESEGIDKYIAIAKNEILKANFADALKALDSLTDEHKVFEDFSLKLKFRIRILQLVQDIENKIINGK